MIGGNALGKGSRGRTVSDGLCPSLSRQAWQLWGSPGRAEAGPARKHAARAPIGGDPCIFRSRRPQWLYPPLHAEAPGAEKGRPDGVADSATGGSSGGSSGREPPGAGQSAPNGEPALLLSEVFTDQGPTDGKARLPQKEWLASMHQRLERRPELRTELMVRPLQGSACIDQVCVGAAVVVFMVSSASVPDGLPCSSFLT